MRSSLLKESILATIIYYDCLGMTLTPFEVWTRLIKPLNKRNSEALHHSPSANDRIQNLEFSLYEVVNQLEKSAYLKNYISSHHGFWFLQGHEDLVKRRVEAMKESDEKLKKLFRYRWIFLATPFLRAAFVSGSVAGGWLGKQSDIDILAVTKKGRIWTARFFLTLFAALLGVRRHGKVVANQICLNHYISDHALSIPFESLYNAHTYINLIPLADRHDTFTQFFTKNAWIRKYLWNPQGVRGASEYVYQFPRKPLLECIARLGRNAEEVAFSGVLGDAFEAAAKQFQLYRIRRNPLSAKTGGRIQAGDFQLEFHPQSKERNVLMCYNKKLQSLGLGAFYPERDSGLSR